MQDPGREATTVGQGPTWVWPSLCSELAQAKSKEETSMAGKEGQNPPVGEDLLQ